jgi:hypothetical protein
MLRHKGDKLLLLATTYCESRTRTISLERRWTDGTWYSGVQSISNSQPDLIHPTRRSARQRAGIRGSPTSCNHHAKVPHTCRFPHPGKCPRCSSGPAYLHGCLLRHARLGRETRALPEESVSPNEPPPLACLLTWGMLGSVAGASFRDMARESLRTVEPATWIAG